MVPGESIGIQYLATEDSIPFYLNRLITNLQNSPFPQPGHEFVPETSMFVDSSHCSDTEEQKLSIIDERKQRRMISNRESARRSRMRKQRHLDELWSQVVRLRAENHNLMDKLSHVSECRDRVFQENARLKEEASDLRQMLTDLQIGSPYTSSALRALEEVPCNTAHLRDESSSDHSVTTSVDFAPLNQREFSM